jgi:hypothetical protein
VVASLPLTGNGPFVFHSVYGSYGEVCGKLMKINNEDYDVLPYRVVD